MFVRPGVRQTKPAGRSPSSRSADSSAQRVIPGVASPRGAPTKLGRSFDDAGRRRERPSHREAVACAYSAFRDQGARCDVHQRKEPLGIGRCRCCEFIDCIGGNLPFVNFRCGRRLVHRRRDVRPVPVAMAWGWGCDSPAGGRRARHPKHPHKASAGAPMPPDGSGLGRVSARALEQALYPYETITRRYP